MEGSGGVDAENDGVLEMQIQTEDDPSLEQLDSGRAAMSEFFRAAAPDDSSQDAASADPASDALEFSLLVILQPDNVRHRVVATPEMTIAALTTAICRDLKLHADLIAFPGLTPPSAEQSLQETSLALLGFDGRSSAGEDERMLQAYVAKKTSSSDYVMPDRIQVQIYDGGLV